MGEEWKTLAIGALGIVCALLGWLGNVMWSAIKDVREEHRIAMEKLNTRHSRLELHLSDNFVRKDDLKERLQEVMQPFKESLDEIKTWIRAQQQ